MGHLLVAFSKFPPTSKEIQFKCHTTYGKFVRLWRSLDCYLIWMGIYHKIPFLVGLCCLGAFIRQWAFIRSFTVLNVFLLSFQASQRQLHLASTHGLLEHLVACSSMYVRTFDVLTRLRYVTSRMTAVITQMNSLVAPVVHSRVIATRVGDSRQALTTLTGGAKKGRLQVQEQDLPLTTPWVRQM